MFLKTITYFICDADRVVKKEIHDYSPRGILTVTVHDLISDTSTEREQPIDLSRNWDRFPEFEDYDHLLVMRSDML